MPVSESALTQGFTVTEYSRMFAMSGKEARERMADVPANGLRDGRAIYRMKDAAPRFAKLSDDADVIERVLTMKHTDLPKMLAKEWWSAQLNKQRFETLSRDLWPTTEIVEVAGIAFKTLRLSLMLLPDTIERAVSLNEEQRAVIQQCVDEALNAAREALVNGFANERKAAVSGPPSPEEDGGVEDL